MTTNIQRSEEEYISYLIMVMALSQMIITLFQGQITTEFQDTKKDIKAI